MRVRIKRSVSVHNRYKKPFLELLIKACEAAKDTAGIDALPYIETESHGDTFNVKVFSDFESLAQYEEKFLHQMLKSDPFLDGAGSAAHMILDNPRDELLVRLETDDYFMNRKDRVELHTLEEAEKGPQKKFLVERMFNAKAGNLRDTMAMTFRLMDEFAAATNIMPKYYCTRFAADRIGGSATFVDFDDPVVFEKAFVDFENKIDTSLFLRPMVDTYFRRVDAELIASVGTKEEAELLVAHH
ncbi:hypothetical protein [uncultured Sphingomonas sp.]|uniref:hypothetical protein n=1 Tax=uncultured Sphingomonas sp. TaxID=158754 RepID=UPI0025F05218|nr:hypothetical protein [uncultured Sphingomonas sp.]